MTCEWVQVAIADGTLVALFGLVAFLAWVKPRTGSHGMLRKPLLPRPSWRTQLRRPEPLIHHDDHSIEHSLDGGKTWRPGWPDQWHPETGPRE